MSIDEKEIKILWGRAGGRCSLCNIDLTIELENSEVISIGEMAHVIAKKENGPRGSEKISSEYLNTYQNLILLCNNHHEMIDKAPKNFSVEQILSWKKEHELRVRKANEGDHFTNKKQMISSLKRLLVENGDIHKQYGPESFVAKRNPLSKVKVLWDIKKLTVLIPNNRKIIKIIESNKSFLNDDEYEIFLKFKLHAFSFEKNSFERVDNESVEIFPIEFKDMIFKEEN